MEKDLFRKLYKRACELEVNHCPPGALSDFLHGYLSVYSMVRVYPWLESEFGEAWDIHERVREIARVIQQRVSDKDLPADTRVGYVVDLMDAYQLYSDMAFLDTGLDVAYEILTPRGGDKIVLPCRTPNVCRLLCNCYYFTSEEDMGLLAKSLVTEILGLSRKLNCEELTAWWNAIRFYENVLGEMEVPVGERERLAGELTRLGVSVEQMEDEKVEYFKQTRSGDDVHLLAEVFEILARREFADCNESYSKRE